ncbi:M50 family metallopeptidase [Steroidobacter flavus]|uniref:M50 family metallopeptidase n=1 Tax=Steroidobacter flavus TaxID=1842136 RepID=A0ABV8T2K0_9GAMM
MDRPKGSVELARIHRVPVYLHWSFPVGALFPIGLARFDPVPSIYLLVGYVLLVLWHELGHLVAARLVKHQVVSIEISGTGGLCRTELPRDTRSAVFIYSGGLIAQLILLLIAVPGFWLLDELNSEAFSYFLIVAVVMNAAMFILNVIPGRGINGPTDGFVLWAILKYYVKRMRRE